MADYNLSFHDLYLIDGFRDAVDSQNKEVFEAILFENGMDVSLGYEIAASTHRVLPRRGESEGKIYTGFRVEGFERTDPDWIATEAASIDAQIEASTDPSLRHELRKMKYIGIQDKGYE